MKKVVEIAVLIFVATLPTTGWTDGIGFKGQGENSAWEINGIPLNENYTIPPNDIYNYLVIEGSSGGSCQIEEEGMRYYKTAISLQITDEFIGSNSDLLGQRISLNVVFSLREELSGANYDLPNIAQGGYSVGFRDRRALDILSGNSTNSVDDNISGFIQALFTAKYYDTLYSNENTDSADRSIANDRRFQYARLAANFLHQQHARTNSRRIFRYDPIVVPDGDAYTLLLDILNDAVNTNKNYRPSRDTVLSTRYRGFWFLYDRIRTLYKNEEDLTQELIDAAKSISECILQADGLEQVDNQLFQYLASKDYYVPSLEGESNYDLSKEDSGVNIWRLIYNYRTGAFPNNIPDTDLFLEELFSPIN